METISFDHAGLVKLYQQGYFDADAYLDKQTLLLVWDCHDLGLKNCRSLILDTKRGIIISDKETTRLVNQFIKQQPVGLLLPRALVGSFAKKTPCLPYVWGKILLVPLSGYTRHATSWVRLDHVYYDYFSDPDHITFIFDHDDKTRYVLPINKKTYLSNLKTTTTIYYRLHQIIHEINADFSLDFPNDHSLCNLENQLDTLSLTAFLDDYLTMIINLIYRESGVTSASEVKLIKDRLKQRYDHL